MGPRIYNLFPRLVGKMDKWKQHVSRIKNMEFDWIYVNPFHYTGFSGSLYAPKNYYDFNPLFVDMSSIIPPIKQLEEFIEESHKNGIKVIMDLVINHTSKDHPFTKTRRNWFKLGEDGNVVSPGAWDNGNWIEWGDLAIIDNENSPDKQNLWNYWRDLIMFYLERGFDGFRADAAYSIPSELWIYLKEEAKTVNKDAVFFAESLGCTMDKTLLLADSGFDYLFNSSKWWNFSDKWLLEQYEQTSVKIDSIGFPESHDTLRLPMEVNNDLNAVKQRMFFTAFFSSGWMIPIGFEYGFKKKTDVIKTFPSDWEPINYDISDMIKNINKTRSSYGIFNKDAKTTIYNGDNNNVLIMQKTSKDKTEKALIILNKDIYSSQTEKIASLKGIVSEFKTVRDISIEKKLSEVKLNDLVINLSPGEVKILHFDI